MENDRISERGSSPGPSRPGKRKARMTVKDESDDDTDDGFEKMDVDVGAEAELEPNSANEDERQTDNDDEPSTADEDSGDEAPPVKLPTRTTNNPKASASTTANEEPVIPPKRDLPFAKKVSTPIVNVAAPILDGSETESDDEL